MFFKWLKRSENFFQIRKNNKAFYFMGSLKNIFKKNQIHKKIHHFKISISIVYDREVYFLANPRKECSYTIYADHNYIY